MFSDIPIAQALIKFLLGGYLAAWIVYLIKEYKDHGN